jgi:hypothetical protein
MMKKQGYILLTPLMVEQLHVFGCVICSQDLGLSWDLKFTIYKSRFGENLMGNFKIKFLMGFKTKIWRPQIPSLNPLKIDVIFQFHSTN